MVTLGWTIVLIGFGALVIDVLLLDKERFED